MKKWKQKKLFFLHFRKNARFSGFKSNNLNALGIIVPNQLYGRDTAINKLLVPNCTVLSIAFSSYVCSRMKFELYRCLFSNSDLKLLPFKQGTSPAAVRSSLPARQSPLCPRAIPCLSGGGVDISGIAKPFSTPKLFIFILSWHFNTPLCGSTDPLPEMKGEKKTPSPLTQLSARGKKAESEVWQNRRPRWSLASVWLCVGVCLGYCVCFDTGLGGVQACTHKYVLSRSLGYKNFQ